MPSTASPILLPSDLLEQIDSFVGPEQRSDFVIQAAREELRRRRLEDFFNNDEVGWKDEDHPELVALGSYGWVRKLREESDRGIPTSGDSSSAKEEE